MENRPKTVKEAGKLESSQPTGTFLVFAPNDPLDDDTNVFLKVTETRWEVFDHSSRLRYSRISVAYWICDETYGVWSFS